MSRRTALYTFGTSALGEVGDTCGTGPAVATDAEGDAGHTIW